MVRREYPKEFKQEGVEFSYRQGGAKTAKSLGVVPNMLYRLRRELARAQEDNVIYAMRSTVVRLNPAETS